VASFPNGLPRDFKSVAQDVVFLELKNLRLALSTFVGAHKLARLQKLYITDAWIDGREKAVRLSAQLPRTLSELVVTRALPESIKFRVPDPELDRELGTYYGGN
jgi:hypothetical protein